MTQAAAATGSPSAKGERGWRFVLPALVFFLLVPAVPQLRVLLPVEQTVLLVAPGIAALAVVAWLRGGRTWLALTWLGVSAWLLARPLEGTGSYDYLARGWALLLAAAFGTVSIVARGRNFFERGLAATGLALALALAVGLFTGRSFDALRANLANELDRRVAASSAAWTAGTQSLEWQKLSARYPRLARVMEEGERRWRQVPQTTLRLFPSLLALESLAALALAWALFHRMSRTRVGPPLAPLRAFRFSDQLVWGLIAGLVIALTPALAAARDFGINLVVFFGCLFALRGLGVVVWFLAPRRLVGVVVLLLAVAFWPIFGALALAVGLGDTWVDWRARARPATT